MAPSRANVPAARYGVGGAAAITWSNATDRALVWWPPPRMKGAWPEGARSRHEAKLAAIGRSGGCE
jgi:hypothetical protein